MKEGRENVSFFYVHFLNYVTFSTFLQKIFGGSSYYIYIRKLN